MHVYGDFVVLPDKADGGLTLPVPWYCRAPLGLERKTSVYVALALSGAMGKPPKDGEPDTRRMPDIIVTVMNPERWGHTSVVRVTRPDESGLLSKVLNQIRTLNEPKPLVNIVIGESITLTGGSRLAGDPSTFSGSRHEICLYCEHLSEGSHHQLEDWCAERNKEGAAEHWRYAVHHYAPARPDRRPHGPPSATAWSAAG